MAQFSGAVRILSSDVLALHEEVRHLRPPTYLVLARNAVWTLAGMLLSAASSLWIVDHLTR